MKNFIENRSIQGEEEIWLLQHPVTYTQGQRDTDVPSNITITKSDRGGLITCHGPGQLICYPLLNLHQRHLGPRRLIATLEQVVIELLSYYGITGMRKNKAPGVYVSDKKIASLGIRVRNGCCYHGLSLNIGMDLRLFDPIDTCGFPGLEVTQIRNLGVDVPYNILEGQFLQLLLATLDQTGDTTINSITDF